MRMELTSSVFSSAQTINTNLNKSRFPPGKMAQSREPVVIVLIVIVIQSFAALAMISLKTVSLISMSSFLKTLSTLSPIDIELSSIFFSFVINTAPPSFTIAAAVICICCSLVLSYYLTRLLPGIQVRARQLSLIQVLTIRKLSARAKLLMISVSAISSVVMIAAGLTTIIVHAKSRHYSAGLAHPSLNPLKMPVMEFNGGIVDYESFVCDLRPFASDLDQRAVFVRNCTLEYTGRMVMYGLMGFALVVPPAVLLVLRRKSYDEVPLMDRDDRPQEQYFESGKSVEERLVTRYA